MKKNLKKRIGVLALAFLLAFAMTACGSEGQETKETQNPDAWMEETVMEIKGETETEPAETQGMETEATETPDEDEYFDVASADDEEKDYSKYEEETSTEITQDEYLTAPVPEGMPEPVEPEEADVDTSTEKTCYLSISCATILDNMDNLTEGKESLIPADGMIYSQREVVFYEGESVFDVLARETQNNRIHMEYNMTPMYNSAYIEGINNLYEFDCGENSGWNYCVNGWYPNYGCSRYAVQEGDVIEWNYTCDLGRDLNKPQME